MNVVALSGDMFDAIEVMAARTGNHKRAAVRMSRLAVQASLPAQAAADPHREPLQAPVPLQTDRPAPARGHEGPLPGQSALFAQAGKVKLAFLDCLMMAIKVGRQAVRTTALLPYVLSV